MLLSNPKLSIFTKKTLLLVSYLFIGFDKIPPMRANLADNATQQSKSGFPQLTTDIYCNEISSECVCYFHIKRLLKMFYFSLFK